MGHKKITDTFVCSKLIKRKIKPLSFIIKILLRQRMTPQSAFYSVYKRSGFESQSQLKKVEKLWQLNTSVLVIKPKYTVDKLFSFYNK